MAEDREEGGGKLVDVRKVAKLIQLLEDSNLDEMQLESQGVKIILRRNPPPVASAVVAPAQAVPAAAPPPRVESTEEAPADKQEEQGEPLKSPIVGTYYEAPTPGSKPFVVAGQRVREGETLCIVEAMKMMNSIKAPRGGVVTRIAVNNGQPVEYGQALMYIL